MARNEALYDREFSHRHAPYGIDAWVWNELPGDLAALWCGDFTDLFAGPTAEILQTGPRTTILRREWQDGGGKSWRLIIKEFRERRYPLGLERLRSRSRAVQNLEAALLLRRNAISTALPLAAVEHRSRGRLDHSYYVTEEIRESVQLRMVWKTLFSQRSEPECFLTKRGVLQQLAELIARIHGLNLYHPDLKDSNILTRLTNGGSERFVLVDLDRLREERKLSRRKRIKNLMQICRTQYLTERDKLFFLKIYADRLDLTRKERGVLNRRVIALCRNEETKRKLPRREQ